MLHRVVLFALLLALFAASARAGDVADPYPRDDVLRLNHVQAVGTHNSYHVRSPLVGHLHEYDYEHAPLDVQLDDQGVRKFELDLYWDLDLGVFRVHHLNFVDQETRCEFLSECLETLRDWSLAHRGHHPIFLMIEPKGIYYPETLSDETICDPPEHEVCHYDDLDAELRSVLAPDSGPNLLIEPDEVRGAHATLREAIVSDGWPTLRATRGRFLGAMLGEEDLAGYTAGRLSLEGRALFVASSPGSDDAAVIFRDDPIGDVAEIQALSALGYVLRTRTDVLDDAQAGDTTRRDAALASGAHYLSTDYPVPEYLENGYYASIPGGMPSGCNPISAQGLDCGPLDIENPAALAPEPGGGVAALAALAGMRRRRGRIRERCQEESRL
jgi:Phosphoinositide phospholipase C, Ca2+-dependent